MKNIFPAVFSSVWKRKETKIFLAFSLYPLVFLAATLFPDSNFMQISVKPGVELSLLELFNLLLGSINSLTLPIVALYYLTYTVFKNEFDDSTMFLYKDINRKKIFLAKLYCLTGVVGVFLATSFLITVFVNYTGAVRMPYGSMRILPSDASLALATLSAIFNTSLDFVLSIFIGMIMSFYFKPGITIVSAIIIGIVTEILAIIGGYMSFIYPTGYTHLAFSGKPLLAFGGAVLTALLYIVAISKVGTKKFSNLEF